MRRATVSPGVGVHFALISIHALHEESDYGKAVVEQWTYEFQSTLSMRRATPVNTDGVNYVCISIHALHEESDRKTMNIEITSKISIHALHEESDDRFAAKSPKSR